MAEETVDASISAPRGILFTCVASAITGFTFLLGLLYAMGDNLDGANNGNSESVIVNIISLVYPIVGSALAIICVLIGNLFFAGFSSLTVTSRIGFAMARDGALPFSKFFAKVDEKT